MSDPFQGSSRWLAVLGGVWKSRVLPSVQEVSHAVPVIFGFSAAKAPALPCFTLFSYSASANYGPALPSRRPTFIHVLIVPCTHLFSQVCGTGNTFRPTLSFVLVCVACRGFPECNAGEPRSKLTVDRPH